MLTKTLIILDTNTLRHVINDISCLNDFRFGGSFIGLIDWIKEKGLNNAITIGIPHIVVDELLVQRKEDFKKLSETIGKYEPHFDGIASGTIGLLGLSDYENFIKGKIQTYIEDITGGSLGGIAVSILKSANQTQLYDLLYDQVLNRITPLNKPSAYKDAYIIALANEFAQKPEYDICLMFSENKNDFNSVSFHEKIEYISSYESLIVKLESKYNSYLENKVYYDWGSTEYYSDILKGELEIITSIEDIDGNPVPVSSYELIEKLSEISLYIYQDDGDTDFSDTLDNYMKLGNKIRFTGTDGTAHERILFLVVDQSKNIIKTYLQ